MLITCKKGKHKVEEQYYSKINKCCWACHFEGTVIKEEPSPFYKYWYEKKNDPVFKSSTLGQYKKARKVVEKKEKIYKPRVR